MITQRVPGRQCLAVATLVVLAAAGCASPVASPAAQPDASCVGVYTEVPTTAEPGATIELDVANLFAECNDTGGGGSNAVLREVQLDLRTVDTAGTVIATARADVAADATAVVRLTIPADAVGTLSLEYDGVSLGTVTVSG